MRDDNNLGFYLCHRNTAAMRKIEQPGGIVRESCGVVGICYRLGHLRKWLEYAKGGEGQDPQGERRGSAHGDTATWGNCTANEEIIRELVALESMGPRECGA
jgi:hypothetical protein